MIKHILLILCLTLSLFSQEKISETTTETIKKGLSDIKSDNPKTRRSAVLLLGKYTQSKAVKAVCDALTDPSPEVRQTALVTVKENIQSSVSPNQMIFTSRGNITVNTAKNHLKSLETAKNMIKLIGDKKIDIRRLASAGIREASYALMFSGENISLTALCSQDPELKKIVTNAFSDKDAGVRQNMFSHYSSIRTVVSDYLLERGLKDPDRKVKTIALSKALMYKYSIVVDNFTDLMESDDQQIRHAVIKQLRYRCSQSVLKQEMKKLVNDSDPTVAGCAVFGLLYCRTYIDEQKLTDILEGLKAVDPEIGKEIVTQLGHMNKYSKFLKEISSRKQSPYSLSALIVLVKYDKNALSTKELVTMMDSNNPALLRACRNALSSKKITVDDLLPIVDSEHLAARQELLNLVYRFSKKQDQVDLLDELILDENEQIRASVVSQYISYRCTDWKEIAKVALEDSSELVAYKTTCSLLSNSREGLPILREVFEANSELKGKMIKFAKNKKDSSTLQTLTHLK